ncbi:MAG TPA: M23 family metallopeptidase [Gemmatimonadaceae bacterium]|nr:M23 family metallopeptidase [Gemmatimonadaceae bacterium]
MPQRRWTLLVVPHGCGSPRTISLSERGFRALATVAAIAGVVAMLCVAAVVVELSMPSLRARFHGNQEVTAHVAALQARLNSVGDTLRAITERDDRIRMLAGLPADSQELSLGDVTDAGLREPITSGPAAGRYTRDADIAVDRLIHRANWLAASFAEVSDTLERNVELLNHTPSIMPTAGWLSSAFSRDRYHPILHIRRPHDGIDVAAPMGTPIVAPAAGVVSFVGREHGYGNVLEIDHGNRIETKYAHCSRILVKKGQHVERGEKIALVGDTGLSTGPHLHYEIHVDGKVVNPLTYVLPDGASPE